MTEYEYRIMVSNDRGSQPHGSVITTDLDKAQEMLARLRNPAWNSGEFRHGTPVFSIEHRQVGPWEPVES